MLTTDQIRNRALRLARIGPALIAAERVEVLTRALRSTLDSDLQESERIELYDLLAGSLVIANDFASALDVLDRNKTTARGRYLRAYCLTLTGSARQAIRILARHLRDDDARSDQHAENLACLGVALYRTGHYKWSAQCLIQSASIFRITGNRVKLVHSLMDLALVYKNQGNHHLSLSHLNDAVSLITGRSLPRTRLALLINRGICLLQLGRFSQARTSFMRAESIARETKNSFSLITIHNNLGHIYRVQGNYRLAMEFYESALRSSRRQKARRKECLALEFLGETLHETSQNNEAIEKLTQALSIALSSSGYGDLVGEILRRRGESYAAIGDEDRAKEDLCKAKKICQARGERREALLAERGIALHVEKHTTSAFELLKDCLDALREIGDRFEYSRTVYAALASGRFAMHAHRLSDDLASATHYFREMGSTFWKERLASVRGGTPTMHQFQPLTAPGGVAFLSSRSSVYLLAQREAEIAARGHGPILLLGESGCGKEILARHIHATSPRQNRSFVAINCGALPGELIESELFGHAKGAFTGSTSRKEGLLEAAKGGFVLLDEIGDLPMEAQVKLLRFLDTGEYRKVGETAVRYVDARIIAATNKNLESLISEKIFREDLWYRLQTFTVRIPPLRDRPEDILPLFYHFLDQAHGSETLPSIDDRVVLWVRQHTWPGNVRELKNLADYLVAASWGESKIAVEHLPRTHTQEPAEASLSNRKEQLERNQLISALEATHGRITDAAELLSVGRNTVTRKMQKFGLRREDFL